MPGQFHGTQRLVSEWSYLSSADYRDPFNEVTLDVVIDGPAGESWRVPAFWSGGQQWRVRFAPPAAGEYRCRSVCSASDDQGLHDQHCTLTARPYRGDNPLFTHGPLRVSQDKRHFVYADGTPFFYLADTWWMSLCQRLHWPEEFQGLCTHRVNQGYTAIQVIAGLYPDMPPFDPRGANEAGYPWAADFAGIHPAYFDMADQRIAHMVYSGLLPCIVGCWGYFLPIMGVEKLKQHWRYLVARWGAYPVLWCLCGEGAMPYYLSQDREKDVQRQIDGWTDIGRYLRSIDPMHHPITIHPTDRARKQVRDPAVLDWEMLQTGHSGHQSAGPTIKILEEGLAQQPAMPVLNSEVCYEGILGRSGEEIQRLMFWNCVLRGACGHTYGGNGIWQLDRAEQPYGASPHGASWSTQTWQEAARLPGGRQVGLGKKILTRLPWWRLVHQPQGISPAGNAENPLNPTCAAIPGEAHIAYVPNPIARWSPPHHLHLLEPGAAYQALYINPRDGKEHDLGLIRADAKGAWQIPGCPILHDWLVLVQRA